MPTQANQANNAERDKALAKLGFAEYRPGQSTVVDLLLNGGSALAVFPTGGGKSLCYQLPALLFPGVTLVVSPLIALMKDQIDFLRRRGIPAARLDSTLSGPETRGVNDDLRDGRLKLLYVAPERFNNERFLAQIREVEISLFAVDEAHCISEWGHNFRPDYLKLARTARKLGARRILALTATATPAVQRDICAGFEIPAESAVVTGFYRPNLNLAVTAVDPGRRDGVLLTRLRKRRPGATIVYVTLQKTAERVAEMLAESGLPAQAYHAGLGNEQRESVQNWWMAEEHGIVVATIAFGMGIDKAAVRYIYHYNLPKSLESYSQEIGRAGRDGVTSTVEMLACRADMRPLENFAYGDTPAEISLRSLMEELLSLGRDFDVNLYDLSARHDLRPLVLQTALTYLELMGVFRQGTPFYAAYEIQMRASLEELAVAMKPYQMKLLRGVLQHANFGKKWHKLSPDEVAEKLGEDRPSIVRLMESLEENGWATVRAADSRQRYTVLKNRVDAAGLARELAKKFVHREDLEIKRLQQIVEFATHDGCLVNALVGYFGEVRAEPCGHCTYCVTGKAVELAPAPACPPIEELASPARLRAIRRENGVALGEARQMARFLCGLSSPATTRAKLTRDPLFGALEHYPFSDVIAWCDRL